MLIVPRDVAGSSCSSAIGVKSLMHRLQNLRIAAHSKVVIGAPDRDTLFLRGHVSTREFLGETVDVVEVAIGLVLVLLVQLGLVEALIVELDRLRSRRLSRGNWGILGLITRGFRRREGHLSGYKFSVLQMNVFEG